MSRQRKYPDELRRRAVEHWFSTNEAGVTHRSFQKVADELGIHKEALRNWVRQAERDRGTRGGLTTEEHEELKTLRKENFELRRANEILKSASVFFAKELDRPRTK